MRYGLKKTKWRDVAVDVTLDCDKLGEAARVALAPLRSADPDERVYDFVEIHFLSSGCFVPAKLYGPPENCHPEEWDEERLIESVVLYMGETTPVTLPQKVVDVLERDPVVSTAIAEAELPEPEYPDPENYAFDSKYDR